MDISGQCTYAPPYQVDELKDLTHKILEPKIPASYQFVKYCGEAIKPPHGIMNSVRARWALEELKEERERRKELLSYWRDRVILSLCQITLQRIELFRKWREVLEAEDGKK